MLRIEVPDNDMPHHPTVELTLRLMWVFVPVSTMPLKKVVIILRESHESVWTGDRLQQRLVLVVQCTKVNHMPYNTINPKTDCHNATVTRIQAPSHQTNVTCNIAVHGKIGFRV